MNLHRLGNEEAWAKILDSKVKKMNLKFRKRPTESAPNTYTEIALET